MHEIVKALYPAMLRGNQTPIRIIQGTKAKLGGPISIAIGK